MYPEFFDEIRAIRSELADSGIKPEPMTLIGRFARRGVQISPDALHKLAPMFESTHVKGFWPYLVPGIILHAISTLLTGQNATAVFDPWAGCGELLATVSKTTGAIRELAFTRNMSEFEAGKTLAPSINWHLGDPLALIGTLNEEFDVVASIPPFNTKSDHPVSISSTDGTPVELKDSLGNSIIAVSLSRLNVNGIALFVVPASFFFNHCSVLRSFPAFGFGVEAALALPSGTFSPYTGILTYLIVVRKHVISKMFVGQLSFDERTNLQVLSNFKERREGGKLELGRLVDPMSFSGLEAIRREERLRELEHSYGSPAIRLGDLATTIDRGRFGDHFRFPKRENCIYIPLLGVTDVVDSLENLKIKPQNYAQVSIDPKLSKAQFVAHFLNSEFGREIREENKVGSVIPKLNNQKLKELWIFVPDLQKQESMLAIETRIAEERNTLLGMQNELSDFRRELWKRPRTSSQVNEQLKSFSARLSGSLRQHTAERLENWFETLPFPLASILRTWRTVPSQDFKSKYEHLLHFFEAVAEFSAVVFLSAFSSNEKVFAPHRQKLGDAMEKQNLSFHHATFGTWKIIVEFLGKQTRDLLSGDREARSLCAQLFSDPTLVLPTALSNKGLAAILSRTNKLRNDWTGHGGIVGAREAQLRNEQLLTKIQELRKLTAETWADIHLVRALYCLPRRGAFDNEIALMMGSNREFVKELRATPLWLDVEHLYLSNRASGQSLKLLPFIRIGPLPQSENYACYFYSRLERDGKCRFVSYHYGEAPELSDSFDETAEAIRVLTAVQDSAAD